MLYDMNHVVMLLIDIDWKNVLQHWVSRLGYCVMIVIKSEFYIMKMLFFKFVSVRLKDIIKNLFLLFMFH